MNITTLEPIEIEMRESLDDVVVYVDGILYMSVNNIDLDDIDPQKVKIYVENTYYDNSYKCSQYVPGTYSRGEFDYV